MKQEIMAENFDIETVAIPRWTIQREPDLPDCPTCGSAVVRIRADDRGIAFCACHVVANWFVSKKSSQ